MSIPTSPFEAISDARRGQAGGAEVLQRDEQARARAAPASTRAASSPRTGRRPGRSGACPSSASPELGAGEHRRAADAVAAGRGAEQDEHVADAGRRAAHQPLALAQPERHRVDQAVVLVGRLEVDLAADRRHADRVAVVADARDGAVEQVARALARSGSPKRSESSTAIGRAPIAKMSRRIPPTPVAAPWNGSTALGWLCDSTLNAHRQPVADVDRARVLARAHHDARALGRQRAQQLLGVLVGAVLAPQQREHRQLDLVGRAAELLADQLVLVARQARARPRRRRVGSGRQRDTFAHASTRRGAARRSSRSAGRPRARGGASGPKTLPASLHTPAMSSCEPLGFWPVA